MRDARTDDPNERPPGEPTVTRRSLLSTAAGAVAVTSGIRATTTRQTETPQSSGNQTRTNEPTVQQSDTNTTGSRFTGVRGAMYFPTYAWNAYQTWANYDEQVVERELEMASSIGLDSLRVLASYSHWREEPAAFFARIEHFLSAATRRGIEPVVVLFEAPPKGEPTVENRTATDPAQAFGVHSPSRAEILQPRNWSGYRGSPLHFARRWARRFGTDSRLLATEVMNEPDDVQPRQDFVLDAIDAIRQEAPAATLTMGCKDFEYNRVYDRNDDIDVHQFHMNLPPDEDAAVEYLEAARQHRETTGKPLWCTEWQRTRVEPPSRFLPNYESLAATIDDAHASGAIDGDFFWGLMLKPAYLREPRRAGRVNGLFHEDGTVVESFDWTDSLRVNRSLPEAWASHQFPYREMPA